MGIESSTLPNNRNKVQHMILSKRVGIA